MVENVLGRQKSKCNAKGSDRSHLGEFEDQWGGQCGGCRIRKEGRTAVGEVNDVVMVRGVCVRV